MVYVLVCLVFLSWVSLILGAAWAVKSQAARFSLEIAEWRKRECESREREQKLVDRLLRQAHVAPLVIERENVVKLPDVETPLMNPIDEAFYLDDILEEIERLHPDARGLTPDAARESYPQDWKAVEFRLKQSQIPLRAS